MYCPQTLFLDLETIPSGDPPVVHHPEKPTTADVLVGNRKGETAEIYRQQHLPKVIAKWEEDCQKQTIKANEEYLKRAVHSLTCEVICLGYAFDNHPAEIIIGSELEIIQKFNALLNRFGDKKFAIEIVGHNIIDFDLKLLYHRAIKHNQYALMRYLAGFNDFQGREKIKDIMKMWSLMSHRDYTKMDDIAKYLGLPGKNDIDGSQVFALWKEGKFEEICEYCKGDVCISRDIYKRMIPMKKEEVA